MPRCNCGWFVRTATQARLNWTLLQCKEDAMADLVRCGWFDLADIFYVRCRIGP
jgi:hypothetical protein